MANVKGGILKKSLIEGDLTYEIWRKAYHKKSCSVSEAAFFKKKIIIYCLINFLVPEIALSFIKVTK